MLVARKRAKAALAAARKQLEGDEVISPAGRARAMPSGEAGKPEEAEQAFRRAHQLADTNPAPWAALILFLAQSNQSRAAAELAEAERALPGDTAHLALAACHEALGRANQAEQHYQAAVAARPTDATALYASAAFYLRTSQSAKAEPLLRTLIDPATTVGEDIAAAARRDLAIALA